MFTISHDYYGILGVSKNATDEEIRSQYRKLMVENHPDQYQGLRARYSAQGDENLLKIIDEKIAQAEEFCKLLNEAFEVLIDPAKRRQYDNEIYEPTVSKPEISVRPTKLTFGSLTEGQRKILSFTIENKGGPVASVNVDWENTEPDWGELVIEPDPNTTFPIKVTVKVDTTGIPSGPKYEKVQVTVDQEVRFVEVYLAVEAAQKPTAPATLPIHTVPTTPKPSAFGGGFGPKHGPLSFPIRLGIVTLLITIPLCVVPLIRMGMERARERRERIELLENFPVEVTEAKRIRCGDYFWGESREIAEHRGILDVVCVVFSIRNNWDYGISGEVLEGPPMHGRFYSALVDRGASFPCITNRRFFRLSDGEQSTYVCFEEEGERVENLCVLIELSVPSSSGAIHLQKTICAEVISIG